MSEELVEDENGAPFPAVAQGDSTAAKVLREILKLHHEMTSIPGYCAHCAEDWPCKTVRIVVDGI